MIRGVSFEIPQGMGDSLWMMLNPLPLPAYDWFCDRNQTEVWCENCDEDLFQEANYTGEAFSKLIQKKHNVVFLKLQATQSFSVNESVHSYSEFLQSNCQIIVLAYDCQYVEIYAKDSKISQTILEGAKSAGYKNVQYITPENDKRIKMDVL